MLLIRYTTKSCFTAKTSTVFVVNYCCSWRSQIPRLDLWPQTAVFTSFKILKNKCMKALNLIRVVAHTFWAADQHTLLYLHRSLVRSKLDYRCIVYHGSARNSYLRMLDPVHNHALRLCFGAYRTSPSPSLCVLANEPPLYIRRRKLSIEYCLKLSSSTQNPTYGSVFECKFRRFFDRKPNQIPPLGIRVEPDLQAGYKKQDTLQYSLPVDPPWLLKRPHSNFSLHSSYKEDTPPDIFLNKFYDLCDEYKVLCRLYTDGSLMENRVACAVVSRTSSESVRLPNNTSI